MEVMYENVSSLFEQANRALNEAATGGTGGPGPGSASGSATGTAVSKYPANFAPHYPIRLPFETSFDTRGKQEWLERSGLRLAVMFAGLYLSGVFIVQQFMESRKPYRLRRALIVWNGLLAVFSILGTLRMLPEMWHVLSEFGLHFSYCRATFAELDVTGTWTWLFAWSKVFELGDTLFILLRKGNLIFLHWYHHATVLLFTWYACSMNTATGRWYITMNFFVHSFMYTYYACRAASVRLPKWMAMTITTFQISQMLMGIYVTTSAYLEKLRGADCDITDNVAISGLLMYASYFVLFGSFFIHNYLTSEGKKKFN